MNDEAIKLIRFELAYIHRMYDRLMLSNNLPAEVRQFTLSILTAKAEILNYLLVKLEG